MGNFGSTLFGLLMFVTWAGLSLAVLRWCTPVEDIGQGT